MPKQRCGDSDGFKRCKNPGQHQCCACGLSLCDKHAYFYPDPLEKGKTAVYCGRCKPRGAWTK